MSKIMKFYFDRRSNLLGSVHRDSSLLHLHDVRRALLNSDDWEPVVLERSVHPASVQVLIKLLLIKNIHF